ncbi:MAG: hypothetical protein LDL41_19595 [Coleofasciculus sp. S288]|nr:hypothetical protein [Coleofasciculus sp. S288]
MLKKLLITLAILLSCVFSFSALNEPALAANPPVQLLTLDDLPTGFTEYSGPTIGNCSSSESQGNAFALQKDTEIIELVCVSSAPLSHILGDSQPESPLGIAFIDALLSNPDTLTQVLGQEKATDLQFLDLAGVGDSAIGFRETIKHIGNTDIAIFRRDKTFNTVYIIHPARQTPLTSLQTIASKLDKRVRYTKLER